MKLYSDYQFASIKMSCDQKQLDALQALADEVELDYIFETGTYKGDGSTKMLADIFAGGSSFKQLLTCEVDYHLFKQAQQNLSSYPKVKVLHGLSVGLQEASQFVAADAAIVNHSEYPDIYIDNTEDPVSFYLAEVNGNLSQKAENEDFTEDLFSQYLPRLTGNVLISLDSAGGMGYLEFQKLLSYINNWDKFWLLLDDTHHLKHFRSKQHILSDGRFTLLAESHNNGWLLAEYG